MFKIGVQTYFQIKNVILSLVLVYILYLIASINLVLGGLLFLFTIVILTFSKHKLFIVYFYIWSVLFQNAFIAYSADFIGGNLTFDILHGSNFFITFAFFITTSIREWKKRSQSKIYLLSVIALLLLLVYTLFGLGFYGFKNAISYLRLFSIFLFMFWIGVYFSKIISEKSFRFILNIIFALTLVSIFGQFFFTNLFTFLMNDISYYQLKKNAESYIEVRDIFYSNTYFNIPSFGQGMRAPGLIKSFISSAYFIVCLSITLYWQKKPILSFLTFFFMAIFVASKGVLLCFFLFTISILSIKHLKLKITTVLFLLLFLWIPIIVYGYNSYNEHLIGFVSGTTYLTTAGNGLGFSGNLSDIRLLTVGGEVLPDKGYWTRFYNGSESALGVLFSSLGFMSLVFLFITFKLLLNVYFHLKTNNKEYIALLCIILFFQGIFQEEAFSPYAFGLVMFVGGFYYKNSNNELTTESF